MVCWSNKAVAPHPTISAVPLPDATLARLIRPCIIPPVQRKSASFLCLQSACRIGLVSYNPFTPPENLLV
ncbi:hypothetical protein, partial [Escherichia coli]|uniref:hypothetical protein n=1 Tax=Escherichia coli TaxID=562 RepID=UPI001BB4717C